MPKNLLFKACKLFFISLICYSCQEPFDLENVYNTTIFEINGALGDKDTTQFISLIDYIPNSIGTGNLRRPSSKAQVEVWVNDGQQKILFLEDVSKKGIYLGPKTFKILPNNTYAVKVTKPDGTQYESTNEKISEPVPITKVNDKLNVIFTNRLGNSGNHDISVVFNDPPAQKNYYYWTYELFEQQFYCNTCDNNTEVKSMERDPKTNDLLFSNCEPLAASEPRRNTMVDYNCDGNCFEIFNFNKINVFSDEFSNGKTIERLIDKIPYRTANKGALIVISQRSLSAEAYKFYKLISGLAYESGGLADTPPVTISGNLKPVGHKGLVTGFFSVSAETRQEFWMYHDPKIFTGNVSPTGILGRSPNLASPKPGGTTIYQPCVEGPFKTKIKPKAWVN